MNIARVKTLVLIIFFFQFFILPLSTHANAASAHEINQYLNTDNYKNYLINNLELELQPQPLTPAQIAELERIAAEQAKIARLQNQANEIDGFLTSKNSPLAGYGMKIAELAESYGVPARLMVAISGVESGFCRVNFRDFNCWGWFTSQRFSSYDESLDQYFDYLANFYYARGYNTPDSIGPIYCPPTHDSWTSKVYLFMSQMNF
ncbi:MAG: hypothetical protein WCJ19_04535 [bacterium]